MDVGNLLRFKACVLYTEVDRVDRPLIHVEVVANVTQPEARTSEVCCTKNLPVIILIVSITSLGGSIH